MYTTRRPPEEQIETLEKKAVQDILDFTRSSSRSSTGDRGYGDSPKEPTRIRKQEEPRNLNLRRTDSRNSHNRTRSYGNL